MAKKSDSQAGKYVSGLVDALKAQHKREEESVATTASRLYRQRESYKKKAQVVDIQSRYLRDGTTEVSDTDEEKVGPTYAKKLEQVVNFNKRYKRAQDDAKKVPGLEKRVNKLTNEKSNLERRLDNQQRTYEKRVAGLERRYGEAKFVKDRLEALRKKPDSVYEKAVKDEKALKRLVEWTYYNGKETAVTYILNEYLALARAFTVEIPEIIKRHDERMAVILAGKNPDAPDDSDKGSNGGSSKAAKKAGRKKKVKKK